MAHSLGSVGADVVWVMVTIVAAWCLYQQAQWFRGKLNMGLPCDWWIAFFTAIVTTLISITILVGTAVILGGAG
jgi:hypothetical protein